MRRNPSKIPPHLILDPLAPIPPSMGKKARLQLQELREAYTYAMAEKTVGTKLNGPEALVNIFAPILASLHVESLAVVAVNTRLNVVAPPVIISRGDIDGTDAPVRAILRAVLVAEGASFFIAHNHPSGDPSPSAGDNAVTTRLATSGRAIDCMLNDHIIIGAGGRFVSLRQDNPGLFR